MDKDQKQKELFLGLIGQYHAMAWIAMGKTPNPATNAIERNLDLASFAIDVLETLEAKTKGNLSMAEERDLQNTLTMLRMNYVHEAQNPDGAGNTEAVAQPDAPQSEEPKEEPSRLIINPYESGSDT